MRASPRRWGFSTPLGIIAIAAFASTLIAQPQPERPTFRTGTTLIEFTLVASDAKGNPVTDLKQNELSITENGRPREIAFFRFEGGTPGGRGTGTTQLAPVEPLSPGIFTNRPEYAEGPPPRNITAIVIDSLNTLPEDQTSVKAQVMRYLRVLPPDTRVAIYRAGTNVRILHDFTDDRESLRARIAKTPTEAYVQPEGKDFLAQAEAMEAEHLDKAFEDADAELQDARDTAINDMARLEEYHNRQLQDERAALTLRSLEALGNHLAGVPGRKSLVWISGGIPILMTQARDRWPAGYEAAIRATAQRLASQGIAIYPVQATGLKAPAMGTSGTARGSGSGQDPARVHRPLTSVPEQRVWSTMEVFSDVTGGRTFRNTNDLTAGVKAAAADLHGTYAIGFYVSEQPDDRWHSFKVNVQRRGVRLLHRQGYLLQVAPTRQPQSWTGDDWESAVKNPLGSTSIRLDARVELSEAMLNVLFQIAGEDLYYRRVDNQSVTELEIGIGERTRAEWTRVRRDGATITMKGNQQDPANTVVRLAKGWPMSPDTSAVRLIVRDRVTGRYGVLDVPIGKISR